MPQRSVILRLVTLLLTLSFLSQASPRGSVIMEKPDEAADLTAKIRRFAPTVITADTSRLSRNDREALQKVIQAAQLLDLLFLEQVWSGNSALKRKLETDKTPLGLLRLHYFKINAGPWSRLDGNQPFIEGVPREKPPQANFYPADLTREEF